MVFITILGSLSPGRNYPIFVYKADYMRMADALVPPTTAISTFSNDLTWAYYLRSKFTEYPYFFRFIHIVLLHVNISQSFAEIVELSAFERMCSNGVYEGY